MSKKCVWVTALAIASALPGVLSADDAQVTALSGTATAGETTLSAGQSVPEGATVEAGAGAELVLSLNEGTSITLGENSSLSMDANADAIRLSLLMGRVTVDASGIGGSNPLYVSAPGLQASVLSSSAVFSVVYTGGQQAAVVVTSGSVRVVRDGVSRDIAAGQYFLNGEVADVPQDLSVLPAAVASAVAAANAPGSFQPGTPGNPPVEIPVINPGQGTNTVSPDRPPVSRP